MGLTGFDSIVFEKCSDSGTIYRPINGKTNDNSKVGAHGSLAAIMATVENKEEVELLVAA